MTSSFKFQYLIVKSYKTKGCFEMCIVRAKENNIHPPLDTKETKNLANKKYLGHSVVPLLFM